MAFIVALHQATEPKVSATQCNQLRGKLVSKAVSQLGSYVGESVEQSSQDQDHHMLLWLTLSVLGAAYNQFHVSHFMCISIALECCWPRYREY